MLLAFAEHAPQARCDSCGSPQIFSVCHHCGKCLCQEHSPRALDAGGRPVSKELDGLDLEGELAAVYHCAEHHHVVAGGNLLPFILLGAGLAIAGALVVLRSLPAGLVLLVLGLGTTVAAVLTRRRRKAAARAFMPSLPVMPALESVRVREALHGQITLWPDGTYASPCQPVTGEVEVSMQLNNADAERLNAYRARYGRTDADPVDFSAGFAVLRGAAGLSFTAGYEPESRLMPGGTGILFSGQVAGHPLFSTGRSRSAGRWQVRLPYTLPPSHEPANVPISIVPSLVPGSDMRTLQLELQWRSPDDGDLPARARRQLRLLRFEVIELAVPTGWGNVQDVTPNALVSSPRPDSTQTIEWKLVAPAKDDPPETKILTIRFEKPIGKQSSVTGHLRASFQGTFSGVTGVGMYWPTGSGWLQPPATRVTMQAEVGFELSLNSVRYQATRVVPDGIRDLSRPETDGYPGVIPGPDTIIDLTNELSGEGYYVKRITENQPRGAGRADLVNRVWDIAGRQYDGVFPIDFHITIMGEEEYENGEFHSKKGNTTARLTVRGAYVNREMEAQVEYAWDTLHEIIATKLKARETPPPAQMPPWS